MKKTSLLGTLTHAATHPLSTASFFIGLARGFGTELARTATGQRGPVMPGDLPGPVHAPIEEGAHEDTQTARLRLIHPEVEPAPQRAPGSPGESFATEPTAVTRDSAHGGRGRDADLDDWFGDAEIDADPASEPAASGVLDALERNDRPGDDQVDHGAVKSVLSETERLRGAR